jgi:hypothetical protein
MADILKQKDGKYSSEASSKGRVSDFADDVSGWAAVETKRLSFGDGVSAGVSRTDSSGEKLSTSHWREIAAHIDELLVGEDYIVRDSSNSRVMVKDIQFGDKVIKAAIKVRNPDGRKDLRSFVHRFIGSRSKYNYDLSAKLVSMGVPAAYPLCYVNFYDGLFIEKSVFIAEYVPAKNLYAYLAEDMLEMFFGDRESFVAAKHGLCEAAAELFAKMRDNNVAHRDAKAGNVLVYERAGGGYSFFLADMDGISLLPFGLTGFESEAKRLKYMSKLGATLAWSPLLWETDYYRCFRLFAEKLGRSGDDIKSLYRHLSQNAAADRYMTLINSFLKHCKRGGKVGREQLR